MAKETIGPLSKAEVQFAVQRLARIADSISSLEKWMKEHPDSAELWVWRAFSLQDGLRRLESVVPEISRAIHAHATGNPQGPDSTKTRKPKSTGRVKDVAEVEAEIEEHRKAVKGQKKKP